MTSIVSFKSKAESAQEQPQTAVKEAVQPASAAATTVASSASSEPAVAAVMGSNLWLGRGSQLLANFLGQVIPPLLGFTGLIAVWAMVSKYSSNLPGPAKTWEAALVLFADPFYINGPNDVGVGWLLLSSLERVGLGFGMAVAVGVPLGFMIGRFAFLNRTTSGIISLLRPVSPLAWLPIGLAVFKAADPSAIFVIFITSIWPMVINTALGVTSVPKDYLNVARVLRLSEWKVFTKILFPAALPYVMTGMRLGLSTAWLVIVAAEMLTGGVGIGFWIWDEWNNLNMEHIIIAIFIIGFVGLLLERGMTLIANRFDYRND